jgi:hypothetical protein
MTRLSRFLVLVPVIALGACDGIGRVGGPCGGDLRAEARAVLPDTGFHAGDSLRLHFSGNDFSEINLTARRPETVNATGAGPHVTVLHGGVAIIDTTIRTYTIYETPRIGWTAFRMYQGSAPRDQIFSGFQQDALILELRRPGETAAAVRVPLRTDSTWITPVVWCG